MEIVLKKQPKKYLQSVDKRTREKLLRALEELSRLEGDIVPLSGAKNVYRYKIDHYRIVFQWLNRELVITVIEINTRTNIKYRRYVQ